MKSGNQALFWHRKSIWSEIMSANHANVGPHPSVTAVKYSVRGAVHHNTAVDTDWPVCVACVADKWRRKK